MQLKDCRKNQGQGHTKGQGQLLNSGFTSERPNDHYAYVCFYINLKVKTIFFFQFCNLIYAKFH